MSNAITIREIFDTRQGYRDILSEVVDPETLTDCICSFFAHIELKDEFHELLDFYGYQCEAWGSESTFSEKGLHEMHGERDEDFKILYFETEFDNLQNFEGTFPADPFADISSFLIQIEKEYRKTNLCVSIWHEQNKIFMLTSFTYKWISATTKTEMTVQQVLERFADETKEKFLHHSFGSLGHYWDVDAEDSDCEIYGEEVFSI